MKKFEHMMDAEIELMPDRNVTITCPGLNDVLYARVHGLECLIETSPPDPNNPHVTVMISVPYHTELNEGDLVVVCAERWEAVFTVVGEDGGHIEYSEYRFDKKVYF